MQEDQEHSASEDAAVTVGKAPRPLSQQVGRIAMIVAGGIFALFALFNAQFVDFSWVFGSTKVVTVGDERVAGGVPLIVLLAVAFVLGGIVGAGLRARQQAKKAAKARPKKK